jgi:uncharacterized protein
VGELRLIILLLLVFIGAPAAHAQGVGTRVALIIANSVYANQTELSNPQRDAALVSAALVKAGFDAPIILANQSKAAMEEALRQFRKRADQADVALIYFAGHGMRVGQTNWLLPIDFDATGLATEDDFESYAVSHRTFIRQLGAAHMRILVLDACRDNPFEQPVAARIALGNRAATVSPGQSRPVAAQGLAAIEADKVLVMYSAAAGTFAIDGPTGATSPFANAFAEEFVRDGIELRMVAGRIRDSVEAKTGGPAYRGAQRPYYSVSLGAEEIYLMGPPKAQGPVGEEAAAFNLCNAALDSVCWTQFLERYPAGIYANTATIVLNSLAIKKTRSFAQPKLDRAREALMAMAPAEWSRGDMNALRTRLLATYGRDVIEQLVAAKDPRAQWIIGGAYSNGLSGYPRNEALGLKLLKQSADSGFGMGEFSFGTSLFKNEKGESPQMARSVAYFRSALSKGFFIAGLRLGYMAQFGVGGVPNNYRDAASYYKMAADGGNALGQAYYGYMIERGYGDVAPNAVEAARLYRLSAAQGDSTGQCYLAWLYEIGRGVAVDKVEALRLYRLALKADKLSSLATAGLARLAKLQ